MTITCCKGLYKCITRINLTFKKNQTAEISTTRLFTVNTVKAGNNHNIFVNKKLLGQIDRIFRTTENIVKTKPKEWPRKMGQTEASMTSKRLGLTCTEA